MVLEYQKQTSDYGQMKIGGCLLFGSLAVAGMACLFPQLGEFEVDIVCLLAIALFLAGAIIAILGALELRKNHV